jgi:hypothetical protein
MVHNFGEFKEVRFIEAGGTDNQNVAKMDILRTQYYGPQH